MRQDLLKSETSRPENYTDLTVKVSETKPLDHDNSESGAYILSDGNAGELQRLTAELESLHDSETEQIEQLKNSIAQILSESQKIELA